MVGTFAVQNNMPELPEVEVSRLGIAPLLEGATLLGAITRCPRLRAELDPELGRCLAGATITAVRRRAKYLLIDCRRAQSRGTLIIHLGMSGSLRFVTPDTPAQTHDHVDLVLADRLLRYRDPRRFGLVVWHDGDDVDRHPLLAGLGPEPLDAGFTGEVLHAALARRSQAIKPALMDASLVVGIGNIYAAEALFRAGISPLRAANRIARPRCAALVDAIQATLRDAIRAGGSSVRDYVHSDGGAGCFQLQCAVYERAGEPCLGCGHPLRQIRQAGRSTYYCPHCQR